MMFMVATAHADQPHVADRREADDVLEVALPEGDERPVDDVDQRQEDDPGQMHLRALRQKLHADAQRRIRAQLHQHARVDHRDGGRRGDVTVRRLQLWKGNTPASTAKPRKMNGNHSFAKVSVSMPA